MSLWKKCGKNMLFTWERSFDPEIALPRSSSGKSNYLGYIYTHTGQLLRRELKPYRIGLLFTRNYGDLGVISVAEQSWTAPISKVERHVSDLDRYLDGNEKGGARTRTDWYGSEVPIFDSLRTADVSLSRWSLWSSRWSFARRFTLHLPSRQTVR